MTAASNSEAIGRLNEAERVDWEPLGEDVTLHTMLASVQHADGRTCMYHSRLGSWTFDGTKRCLRADHPDWSSPPEVADLVAQFDAVRKEHCIDVMQAGLMACACGASLPLPFDDDGNVLYNPAIRHHHEMYANLVREHTDRALAEVEQRIDESIADLPEGREEWAHGAITALRKVQGHVRAARQEQDR